MFASKVGLPPTTGAGEGVGVWGGCCIIRIALIEGASKPANLYLVPWQIVFEQKEVFDVPPGSLVV
jgi:hypothetical protein